MKNTIYNLDPIQNTEMIALNAHRLMKRDNTLEVSKKILSEVMQYKRQVPRHKECLNAQCEECASIHLPKIVQAVSIGEPVTFVLPAFPGKSPNTNKVLGYGVDLAEKLSLAFLGSLCEKIRSFYAPGIKIIICSDGRVFSDVVGMQEGNVTLYQNELMNLINDLSMSDISTFNLDDVYEDLSFNQMRDELMKTYGQSLEFLKHKVKAGAKLSAKREELEANRMYKGITRFLFEDALTPHQKLSRAAVQRNAKQRAYEVIRRSNAWSELIEEKFKHAIRLSIHPQTCGSKKLGIRLVGNESWMTPWHGVALETNKGHVLVKRSEAIELGAKLVYDSKGRASHYTLINTGFGD